MLQACLARSCGSVAICKSQSSFRQLKKTFSLHSNDMGIAGSRHVFQVGLTKKETERLQRRFSRIARGNEQVAIQDLEGVSELNGNPFIGRAFALFDSDSDGYLSLQDFTRAIDILGQLSNSDQQVKFLFQMFDYNSTGYVDASKLKSGLYATAGRTLSSAHLEEVVGSLMAVHDKDGDDALNFEEFQDLVMHMEHERV